MATTFEVLAEPTRRRILDLLRVRERSVGELVAALALSQPGVSKHLRVLRQVGLVAGRHLAHPIERVWAALTEPDQLLAWWGDADVDLVEGGRFTMRWLNADDQGNSPVMHATITRLDPPRLLETSGDIHGVLRWELRPD